MARRASQRMTAAAVAAVLDGLPDIPCMAPVPWPRSTEPNVVTGTRRVRRCVRPNGHDQFDVPCMYKWFTEKVDIPAIDQSEAFSLALPTPEQERAASVEEKTAIETRLRQVKAMCDALPKAERQKTPPQPRLAPLVEAETPIETAKAHLYAALDILKSLEAS